MNKDDEIVGTLGCCLFFGFLTGILGFGVSLIFLGFFQSIGVAIVSLFLSTPIYLWKGIRELRRKYPEGPN